MDWIYSVIVIKVKYGVKQTWNITQHKDYNMTDEEFYFYILAVICMNEVAQLALQDLFETLWNRKYPETLWAKNAASVTLFEKKEEENFQKSLQGLSNIERTRKIRKRNQLQNSSRDDDWKNYKWDTCKYVYALIECKLFTLDQTDETGMPVSEHIVKIKGIRNELFHSTKTTCNTKYFEKTLKSLGDHINAFKLVQINVSSYIEKIQRLKSEEKPVSSKEQFELKFEFEKLRNLQKIYEEREKHYEEKKRSNAKHESDLCEVKEKHKDEIKRFEAQLERLSERNKTLEKANNLLLTSICIAVILIPLVVVSALRARK